MDAESPIKLACMSLMWGHVNLPNDKLPAWLDDVKAAGYDGVALFDRELVRFSLEAKFAEELKARGLALASVDYFLDQNTERLRRVCGFMQSLGARHLVALAGLAKKGANMDEVAAVLNQIGQTALEYGVHAGYHNHTNNTGETLEETETLVGKTDPAKFFGFLDTGHATKDFAGHPVAQRAALFLERNWGRIDFIEFKDWSEANDLNTEVGAGLCDYSAVFRILKDKAYSGWITVEQNGPTPGKTPLECAKASREFIRKGLGI